MLSLCSSHRQRQLEELQVLALQFHESVEPLGEWLSATERRLSSTEPMGTQASKISQQISRHKVQYNHRHEGAPVINHKKKALLFSPRRLSPQSRKKQLKETYPRGHKLGKIFKAH